MNSEKIYFGENLLLLSESLPENTHWALRWNNPSDADLQGIIARLQQGNLKNALIVSGNLNGLLSSLTKHFKVVQAGGGLVFDRIGRVLLIFRRGKWDLPKGKLEEEENIEACALREVSEETGLVHIHARNFLGITRHAYEEKDDLILKETHWYVMDYRGNDELIPQAEEDIERAEWVSPKDLAPYLNNTFPSINDILLKWKGDR